MRKAFILFGALAFTASAAQAEVQTMTISDPIGDILSSYTGPTTNISDLDVTSFTVSYDASAALFSLSASMAGTINPANAGIYVIGVNNGTATNAPFASIGQPNVVFGQTIVVQKAGTATIGGTSLVTMISGNSFTVSVPLSAIAPSPFSPLQYGFNLWPRSPGAGLGPITDFAPNNALLTAVPEPASWAMMIGGFGLVGAALRRRRTERPALSIA